MPGVRVAVIGLVAASLAAAAEGTGLLAAPVKTSAGMVSGMPGKLPGVAAFRGIPFGAPPVGDLRWKIPQPVTPWTGVRAGDKFGPVCLQPKQPNRSPNNRAVDMPDSPPMSEDCLYLNA
jgi:para-nitrobenzyl esterase